MDAIRNGNFTSSEIVALTSEPTAAAKKAGEIFGKTALTYIEECNMERRLGRKLDNEASAKPLSWGKLLEKRVFQLLGTEYIPYFDKTFTHGLFDFWKGSPDANKEQEEKTVSDIKCPMTLKSFCQLVDPLYEGLTGMDAMNKVRENHKDGEKFYFQLVSNAIITKSKFAELIVYCPYKSELDAVRSATEDYEGNPNDVAWIHFGNDESLPHLIDGGYYKNLNVIRFEVPEEDKNLLTECVLKASKLLIKAPSVLIATHETELNVVMVEKGN